MKSLIVSLMVLCSLNAHAFGKKKPQPVPTPIPTFTPVEPSPTPVPSPTLTPVPPKPPIGAMISLPTKVIAYQGYSSLTEDKVRVVLERVNDTWKKCQIRFEWGSLKYIDPKAYGLGGYKTLNEESWPARAPFQDKSKILVVVTQRFNENYIGWTSYPGSSVMGAVIDGRVAEYAPIYSHEFGHYLGLQAHSPDPKNVMYYIAYETAINLTDDQCAVARKYAAQY